MTATIERKIADERAKRRRIAERQRAEKVAKQQEFKQNVERLFDMGMTNAEICKELNVKGNKVAYYVNKVKKEREGIENAKLR